MTSSVSRSLVEEVSSGNVEALGAEELEAAQRFSEDLLRVIDCEKKKLEKDDSALEEITADRPVLPEIGNVVQTRSADNADWSEAAVVVEVGTEENDKKGQLKIVSTAGAQSFQLPHWALMQPLLMRMMPSSLSKAVSSKDGELAGVSVLDYMGTEKLKAAKSLEVDLDIEARLDGYLWAGVHATAKTEHLCPKGKNRYISRQCAEA